MATKNKHTKRSNTTSRIVTAFLFIIFIAAFVFAVFALINKFESGNNNPKTTSTNSESENGVSDKQETEESNVIADTETTYDDSKTAYESDISKQAEQKDSGKKVAVSSLMVAQVDTFVVLSGRVTNFKEEGGKCTYYLKHDDTVKEYVSAIIPDAKNTVCEAVKIEKDQLTSGSWTIWMEYKSDNAEGASETQNIDI